MFRFRMNTPPPRIAVSIGLVGASIAASLLAVSLTGCTRSTEPSADQLAAGMKDYLAKRGDLCLAKTDWPIDLTQHEIDSGARNALQLPVRRYALTDDGKHFFIMREQARPDGGKAMRGDFCAAKLSLDKVQAAPWTGDAELRKVFPVVAQVIQGAGKRAAAGELPAGRGRLGPPSTCCEPETAMTTVVRFPPALGDWVRGHLDGGVAPEDLTQALRERAIEAEAAQAIVDAFVRARTR
ncbi:hypothetical protein Ddc_18819 [Ditylenchus destructor]|nr:hypothetical protein Ddc_18819 [Ditylenchus destructor]